MPTVYQGQYQVLGIEQWGGHKQGKLSLHVYEAYDLDKETQSNDLRNKCLIATMINSEKAKHHDKSWEGQAPYALKL